MLHNKLTICLTSSYMYLVESASINANGPILLACERILHSAATGGTLGGWWHCANSLAHPFLAVFRRVVTKLVLQRHRCKVLLG